MSGHDEMNDALRRRGRAPEPKPADESPRVPADIDAGARGSTEPPTPSMNDLLRGRRGTELYRHTDWSR